MDPDFGGTYLVSLKIQRRNKMEIIKTGLARHECDTPIIDPAWLSDRGPTYKNGSLVRCECGKYYLVTTRGSESERLTWKHMYGIRLRRMLRSTNAA